MLFSSVSVISHSRARRAAAAFTNIPILVRTFVYIMKNETLIPQKLYIYIYRDVISPCASFVKKA